VARTDNKTTRRTLEILEAFHRHKAPMSLTELARVLKAPVSSCHGIVRTLISRGYLYHVDADRTLYPTRRLLGIAEAIAANDPALRELAASLADLRDASGETLILGKRQDNAVLYLDVIESRQTIRYSAQAGDTKPLHSSSIGRALLADMAPEAFDAWLAKAPLERRTPLTVTSPRRLRHEIEAARDAGYHTSSGETTEGVMAVAVAIRLGGLPMGVAIAGPQFRIEPQLQRHANLLLKLRRDFRGRG
jgi:DNA-binding IclR family transcriptional regulator